MTRRRQGRREGADLGLPWHRRGWQIGDDSSDLACAGKVSAVGSVALTKALYLGSGLFKILSLLQFNQRLGGGTGRGRAARAKDATGPTPCCRTPHTGCSRAWPHPFAPAGAALRDAFRWHLTIQVSGDESEDQKFKTIREKLRIPGSYNPTVDRELPRIFNFTASPWPKF